MKECISYVWGDWDTCYDPKNVVNYGIIPEQYQGWFLIMFLIMGTIAICYGLYIIAHDPLDNSPKTDPNRYYHMTEEEIKKIFY